MIARFEKKKLGPTGLLSVATKHELVFIIPPRFPWTFHNSYVASLTGL